MKVWPLLLACSSWGCESFFPLDDPPPKIEYVTSKSVALSAVRAAELSLDRPALDGDLLVIAVAVFHVETLTVTDSAADTFSEPNSAVTTPNGSVLHVMFAKNIPAADPLVVTAAIVSTDLAPEISLAVHLYRGADPDDPLDVSASLVTDADTQDIRCGPVTTTEDGELYFAALAHDGTVNTTPGAGFTEREVPSEDSSSRTPLYTEDMIGPAQTITTPVFELSDTETGGCQLLSFRRIATPK